MIKKVMDYVKKYQMIRPHDTVVAGISGGADSVCLLFVLLEIQKRIPITIKVVHVNHGVRAEAGEDAEFVRKLCEKFGLFFHCVETDIRKLAAESGCSEEEAGRAVRYQAFYEILGEDTGKIAVAHNGNDRAETMLFHLFRGTGLSGASGIRPVNGRIIRPLLGTTREEIEKWLSKRNIAYCTDSTNEQDLYTRNRIRHHILPYAQREVCHGAVANMNRAADDLMMAEDYLRQETQKAAGRCVLPDQEAGRITIDIPAFEREDEYLRGRILLACIEKAAGSRKDVTMSHINAVKRLFQTSGSREIHLPCRITVYKRYDLGMIQSAPLEKASALEKDSREPLLVSVPCKITVPDLGMVEFTVFSADKSQNIPEKTYTKWFDYDKISSAMVFRTRRPGDYLTVKNHQGEMCHKSLQDFFVDAKVPKDLRDRIYLLAENSHIIWIPGHRISEYYKTDEKTCNILQTAALASEQTAKL